MTIPASAIDRASENVGGILREAVEHRPEDAVLVVSDAQCELAVALTEAYRRCLPDGRFIDFDSISPEEVRAAFDLLTPGSLVVLIQSTSFRLAAFRIRLELFKRSIKVIEHPHLARVTGAEGLVYIDSLAYDPAYYRGVGRALKERIDRAQGGVVKSGGEELVFSAAFEIAKLNVGDYTEMANVGGQFPIGEVFTESRDLEAVNGRVEIALFGDLKYSINRPAQPITLVVQRGRVVEALDSTPEFEEVLESIRADEGEVWMRELGFGLNRAFSFERTVSDVGAFERMCGVHLSLGAKHMSYNKPNIKKRAARQHVDVFVHTEAVTLDDEVIYQDGAWTVPVA
ncbi:MAG: hypothetical protein MK291_10100 [Planctomycetes bacterium]|nr:hypothetical protein [Planctomycetota bacterium]